MGGSVFVFLCHHCLAVLHPMVTLAAVARLTVRCRLQEEGGGGFLCPAPGQVWRGLQPESRLAPVEGLRGLSKKIQAGVKFKGLQTITGEAMMCQTLTSLHFFCMNMYDTYDGHRPVICRVFLLFLFLLVGFTPASDIPQGWKFQAVMIGKLSRSTAPPRQLDRGKDF